jgi:hypothetical protein
VTTLTFFNVLAEIYSNAAFESLRDGAAAAPPCEQPINQQAQAQALSLSLSLLREPSSHSLALTVTPQADAPLSLSVCCGGAAAPRYPPRQWAQHTQQTQQTQQQAARQTQLHGCEWVIEWEMKWYRIYTIECTTTAACTHTHAHTHTAELTRAEREEK